MDALSTSRIADHSSDTQSVARRANIWLTRAVLGAASVTVTAAIVFLVFTPLNHPAVTDLTQAGAYSTRLGQHLCQSLPDDSQVCLNTNTLIRYSFNGNTRNVEVVSGEASFRVRSDTTRPFNVMAGGAVIHDLSTSFDVYKKQGSTLVTVIDGRVRIAAPIGIDTRTKFLQATVANAWQSAPEYKRLQQIEFDEATGQLREPHELTEDRLEQLLAWHRGRIILNGRTLGEALEEFSRYQPPDQFEFKFQDPQLRRIVVGGDMEATNLMDFLDAVDHEFAIRHRLKKRADGKIAVMLSRQQRVSSGLPRTP